jgi:NADH:ubiquinone oxidoreductase subunit K
MALALAIYSVGASTFALIPWTKRKRNLIHMVISLELMLLSIGLLLVNISYALDDLIGATLTLYLLPFAGAESAIALALLVAFYPSRLNLSIDATDEEFWFRLFGQYYL